MSKHYDYLIVGSGLFGSVFAHEATKRNKKCLVIDKREHIGGNCYSEKVGLIDVHKYGPHIFHTNSDKIWQYINKFGEFNNFVYRPKVRFKDKIYSFPINLLTLHQVYGIKTPQEAEDFFKAGKELRNSNLEDYIISKIGRDLYEIFIKGYTEKQWGRPANTLPDSIIKRIPIRIDFNDNYFNDKYQGIPIHGYTNIFNNLLEGIEVKTSVDFFEDASLKRISDKIVYTGSIDQYYNYCHGVLEYRSLKFEQEHMNIKDYQGTAVINYTDKQIPWTRRIEHKHFNNVDCSYTIVTKEYPLEWELNKERYYPIGDDKNTKILEKYRNMESPVIFGGRLGSYMYYDMHQVIAQSLAAIQREFYGN